MLYECNYSKLHTLISTSYTCRAGESRTLVRLLSDSFICNYGVVIMVGWFLSAATRWWRWQNLRNQTNEFSCAPLQLQNAVLVLRCIWLQNDRTLANRSCSQYRSLRATCWQIPEACQERYTSTSNVGNFTNERTLNSPKSSSTPPTREYYATLYLYIHVSLWQVRPLTLINYEPNL